MTDQGIIAKCEGCGGEQRLTIRGQSFEQVKMLAGLMDGTSPFYVHPVPRDGSSLIGKCGLCPKGVFRCTLFGFESSVAPVSGSLTDNPAKLDPTLRADGQQEQYLVLSSEERAKGFVRPVRRTYRHVGIAGPRFALRDLTPEERKDWEADKYGYVKYEPYPEGFKGSVTGHLWTQEKLGIAGPRFALRDLTPEERKDWEADKYGYVKYEPYPEGFKGSVIGHLWTQEKLDKAGKGCGATTTMGQAIAETYAREPRFYGSTFCCGCGTHLPVGEAGEFVWDDGSRVGT